jgi:hypothetical protein
MATTNNLFTQGNTVTNVGGYALDATITSTNTKIDALNNTVFLKTLNKNTSSIDISGQTVLVSGGDISIENIEDIPLIEGFALETTLGTTNTKLDTLNTTLTNKVLDKTTSSVDISGQTVAISNTSFDSSNILDTPLITGFALETTLGTTNDKLDTLNTTLTNKVLDKTTSSVDISGQTVAISNTSFDSSNILDTPLITGFALETTLGTTNDKLDTLNTTVSNKHLDKTTDSVDITNQNINVNQTIESSSYDLVLQGSTLWADSLPTPNPFIADLLGREGWWYSNQANVANKSNIYWYANPPTGDPSGFQENDMTFSQLSSMYCVITCDYVDNGSLTIPTMGIFSQPTGTNDIIPTFAHSRWVYQLSSANRAKLRKGETILIYTGATRPNVFNQLVAYPLVQVSVIGEAQPTEIIGYMSINTQATTSIIAYLLQYVGYLNSAVGHIKQYGFKNSKERLAQENLASLTVTDGVLNVSSSGGGSGGVIQGISTSSGLAVDISATPSGETNRLLVDSRIGDGTYILGVNNDGSINTISPIVAKDADNAESTIQIFGKDNRLYTTAEITQGGNTLIVNEDGSINVAGSGSDGKAYLYSGNETSAITATVVDTKTGIDVNIIGGGGSSNVTVDNNLIVSPIVKKQTYDLDLNNDLYSGSTGNNDPPFQRDIVGNQGWYYLNTDPTKSANVYYYLNIPSAPLTSQSDIALTQINFFYAVITLNFVGTDKKNLPYITMASQAVGTDDYIPNVANTIYQYKFPEGNYINGERLVIYWGEFPRKPLETFMPNLRRIKLLQASGFPQTIFGPETGDKLAYFSVNTGLGVTEKQDFTLTNAGYKFNQVGGEQGSEEYNATFDFEFTASTVIESKLSKLTFNESNELLVASAGGGGGDGKAYLYSGDEATSITATTVSSKNGIDANIINASLDTHCYGSSDGTTFHHLKTTATGNLITESKTHDGANNAISSTVVDTKRGLDVNVISASAGGGGVVQLQAYSSVDGTTPVNVYATANRLLTNTISAEPIVGAINNIHSGNLATATFSTALNINNNYGNESVISYKDTSSSVSAFITIWGAFDNASDASYFYIGVLQPVVIRTGNRYASAVLKLKGLKYIRIYNEHTSTVGGVSCSLFSG